MNDLAENTRKNEKALELVALARDPTVSDERLGEIIDELKYVIPYPSWGNLIFHHVPDLSDEEVVGEALRHRPIAL